jgi:hypothetical protein
LETLAREELLNYTPKEARVMTGRSNVKAAIERYISVDSHPGSPPLYLNPHRGKEFRSSRVAKDPQGTHGC